MKPEPPGESVHAEVLACSVRDNGTVAASMTKLLGSRRGLCLHVVSVVPGPVKYLLWDSRQSCRRGFHVLTWL